MQQLRKRDPRRQRKMPRLRAGSQTGTASNEQERCTFLLGETAPLHPDGTAAFRALRHPVHLRHCLFGKEYADDAHDASSLSRHRRRAFKLDRLHKERKESLR